MPKFLIYFKFLLGLILCFPHLILFYLHKNRIIIQADSARWLQIEKIDLWKPLGFIYLLSFYPEYRNLFYHRIGSSKYILNIFCPKMSTLYIKTKDIGEGLFISHGFATGIGAKSIGKNCWINQQVTIGDYHGYPTILDNVRINAGAIIIGNITIGNNSVIGVNATVIKDLPDNSTVFCAPSIAIKWKSEETTEQSIEKNLTDPA